MTKTPSELRSRPDEADPDASTQSVLMLYGATMLSVQGVENAVAWLYAVANTEPAKVSTASLERQWKPVTERLWRSFQKGTAGMKLNDVKTGVKGHVDADLYRDLDSFIKGPRNQLAHRFLIERIRATPDGAGRFVPGTALALLEATQTAGKLNSRLHERAEEIRATWPEPVEPPLEVREYLELVARMAMLKENPARRGEPT